ncbi:MAG: lamin tail domain-containing protein, partial [Verrucomicrobiota bacterium]
FPDFTTLAPGRMLVIVEDPAAFSARYQNPSSQWYYADIQVIGEWVGGLGNSETIELVTSNNTTLLSIDYRAGGDWPERTSGDGSSLSQRTPALAPNTQPDLDIYLNNGLNWRSSSLYHGSPGRFDPFVNAIVIHEVLSHTDLGVDWIELYNRSGGPVFLDDYALTDDLDQPTRYLFPSGTVIAANSFLSLDASQLGFGFSELGSDAALLQVSNSLTARFIDTVDFPAAEREEPFGRHLRSDGFYDFTELLTVTRDASNAPPRIGPVIISEIMFVPSPGLSPYIELLNLSNAPIPLYDIAIPTNIWRFTGVGDFSFPPGTVIGGCSNIVLCATNPATFRAQYGLGTGVDVFGPWAGGLDPDGEQLRLLRPGNPEPDGFVPYYRVDLVSYRTNAFWPTANTGGISLERFPAVSYGNDPINWRASAPGGSPGVDTTIPAPFAIAGSISMDGDAFRVAFPAAVGERYEIQFSDSLLPALWQPLIQVPSAPSNMLEIIDTSVTNRMRRYYRVRWVR